MFSVDYALCGKFTPPLLVACRLLIAHPAHCAQWNAALKLLAWLTHTLERVTPPNPYTFTLPLSLAHSPSLSLALSMAACLNCGSSIWLSIDFDFDCFVCVFYFFVFVRCFLAAFFLLFDRLMRQLQKATQLIRRYIRGPSIYHLHVPCTMYRIPYTYVLFLYLYIFMTFWAF